MKKQMKGRARNNADWALYKMVMSHFKNDERVTWNISDASYTFPRVYDRTLFHCHGDHVGGGNGWAGVWSPLGTIRKKAVDLGVAHGHKVDYIMCGHWHQTVLAHQRGLVCNRSMKGYDEFAAFLGFQPETAAQNFWVETPEKGTVIQASLYLQDRKKEGW